nr:uncharacterized protein LOC107444448 isoform X2 [Parasteatoda tepidariorum]
MNLISSKSRNFYMDIQLDFGEEYGGKPLDMEINAFKYAIFQALKNIYGDMGCIISVDILKYREEDRRAFIRVPSRSHQFWLV